MRPFAPQASLRGMARAQPTLYICPKHLVGECPQRIEPGGSGKQPGYRCSRSAVAIHTEDPARGA